MKKILLILTSLLLFINTHSWACTSVGFAGDSVKGGGTILAKNRDAPINAYERLAIFKPKNKYAYVALTYGSDDQESTYPYIAGGTNEKGLTVLVNDPASHYPKHGNVDEIETRTVRNLLENYATIKDIKAHAQDIFGEDDPALYVISDHNQVANFEAGYDHKYGEVIKNNGYVWNTNYYHIGNVNNQNLVITKDVKLRSETLNDWFKTMPKQVQLGDITRLLSSHYHGEFDSIDREVTVAQYFTVTPKEGAPKLYIKLTIPTQNYNIYNFTANQAFFNDNPAGPLDNKKYGLLGSINEKKVNQFIKSIETASPGKAVD